MKYEPLGNIAELIAGQSPPSSTYNNSGDGIPFFQGKSDYGEINPTIRSWCNKPTKIALPEDILISVRAPVGPVNINNVKACIGRGLSAIRVKQNISRDYVYYFLKTNETKIANLGVGSTFTAITQSDLKEIIIPIPSFTDQTLIASILSKAANLIAQRKESIRLLDEYLKSTFLEMFGDPVRNEKGWEFKKLEKVLFVKHGFAFKSEYFSTTGEYVLLTPGNFNESGGYKDRGEKQKYYVGLFPSDYLLKKGNILIAMTEQAPGLLGSPIIIPQDNKFLHNQRLGLLVFDVQILTAEFLFHFFNFHKIRTLIHSQATGTKVRHTSPTKIHELSSIIPPLTIQNKFAKIAEKTATLQAQFQQSLQELENLYASLSQRAFKGELNIKDVHLLMAAEGESGYRIKS